MTLDVAKILSEAAADGGLRTSHWEVNGKQYAAVWGLFGPHTDSLRERMLASGWGLYTNSCLVWGWNQ